VIRIISMEFPGGDFLRHDFEDGVESRDAQTCRQRREHETGRRYKQNQQTQRGHVPVNTPPNRSESFIPNTALSDSGGSKPNTLVPDTQKLPAAANITRNVIMSTKGTVTSPILSRRRHLEERTSRHIKKPTRHITTNHSHLPHTVDI
jgi:hypothetical protein